MVSCYQLGKGRKEREKESRDDFMLWEKIDLAREEGCLEIPQNRISSLLTPKSKAQPLKKRLWTRWVPSGQNSILYLNPLLSSFFRYLQVGSCHFRQTPQRHLDHYCSRHEYLIGPTLILHSVFFEFISRKIIYIFI